MHIEIRMRIFQYPFENIATDPLGRGDGTLVGFKGALASLSKREGHLRFVHLCPDPRMLMLSIFDTTSATAC